MEEHAVFTVTLAAPAKLMPTKSDAAKWIASRETKIKTDKLSEPLKCQIANHELTISSLKNGETQLAMNGSSREDVNTLILDRPSRILFISKIQK